MKMTEFKFSFHVKVVTWERNTITAKAANLQEAREKILAIPADDIVSGLDLPTDTELVDTMLLFDGIDYYPNDGSLTYEVIDESTSEIIFKKH